MTEDRKKYNKKYYQEHKEERKEYRRRYYKKHRKRENKASRLRERDKFTEWIDPIPQQARCQICNR